MTKSPAFQFYPADYLSDSNVARLSLWQRGAYLNLLCHCWIDGGLPLDIGDVVVLSGSRETSEATESEILALLERCFVLLEDGTGYTHKRLAKERDKQEANRAKRAEAGAKGGDKKAENQRLRAASKRLAKEKRELEIALAKSSSSSSVSTTVVPPLPPKGGGGDLSEIDSQIQKDSAELLARVDDFGVKHRKVRGVDITALAVTQFAKAGGTPEDLEELVQFASAKDDPPTYLESIIRGGESSWRTILDDQKHRRLRIASKRSDGQEVSPHQVGIESPTQDNVEDMRGQA